MRICKFIIPTIKHSFKRLKNATINSWYGLKETWNSEAAFREEIIASILLVPLAFYISNEPWELIMLIGVLVLVITIEIINSAIESTIDRIGVEIHTLSKKAKDQGSFAVALSILFAIFVWLAIIISHF